MEKSNFAIATLPSPFGPSTEVETHVKVSSKYDLDMILSRPLLKVWEELLAGYRLLREGGEVDQYNPLLLKPNPDDTDHHVMWWGVQVYEIGDILARFEGARDELDTAIGKTEGLYWKDMKNTKINGKIPSDKYVEKTFKCEPTYIELKEQHRRVEMWEKIARNIFKVIDRKSNLLPGLQGTKNRMLKG
ncbi:MAG: hypothetical protein KDH96_04705 [Candidatus Riesia sp.]|nr:hypothetical protein [Candidatus Riesia sp.]